LSVHLPLTAFDYRFGILKLFIWTPLSTIIECSVTSKEINLSIVVVERHIWYLSFYYSIELVDYNHIICSDPPMGKVIVSQLNAVIKT
jgi:hypothetical protein